MTVKRNIARKGVIGGLIAGFASAVLPVSVTAQTVGNDPIKQLQDQILRKSTSRKSAAFRSSSTI